MYYFLLSYDGQRERIFMINNCLGDVATDVSILFETKPLKPLIEISQGKVGMKNPPYWN